MSRFAFSPPTRASLRDELRGHEMAMEGMSRRRYEDITNAVDKATDRFDDLPNPNREAGFNKARQIQTAQAVLNRRKLKNG